MIPTKNLLLFVSTLCFLTTMTLAGDPPANYCTTGMCLECNKEERSGVSACTECYNNNIKFQKIGEDKIEGGSCEGKVPFKNCLTVGGEGGTASCFKCLPGFYKQKSVKDCEPIGVPKCLISDGDSTQCIGCEAGTFPNAQGDSCGATDITLTNCQIFGKDALGAPNCYMCKWNYYLSTRDKKTCTERVTNDNHAPCSKSYNGGGYNASGGCNDGCNSRAGYFASNLVSRAIRLPPRLLGGGEGFLSLNSGLQVCTKNPDAPFDPTNPYPPSSDAKLLTWFMSFFTLALTAIHLNCL